MYDTSGFVEMNVDVAVQKLACFNRKSREEEGTEIVDVAVQKLACFNQYPFLPEA